MNAEFTNDPFASEVSNTPFTEAPAANTVVEDDGEFLNTLALNAGDWQGDCRDWQ